MTDAAARPDYEVTIEHEPERFVYGAWIGDLRVGHLDYKLVGHRIALLSTKVAPAYHHHGVGTALVGAVLDDIRTTGKKITIICPVVRSFITGHPEYEDLIDPVQPGVPEEE